jgi:hypothetical protein
LRSYPTTIRVGSKDGTDDDDLPGMLLHRATTTNSWPDLATIPEAAIAKLNYNRCTLADCVRQRDMSDHVLAFVTT